MVKRKLAFSDRRKTRTTRTLARAPASSMTRNFQRVAPIFRNVRANMPLSFTSKLKYHASFTLAAGVAAAATHVFSANSLFDTDVTGGGHQPRGFDQIMAMYDHYEVIGAKITALMDNPPVDTIFAIQVRDNAAGTVNINNVMEAGNVVYNAAIPSAGNIRPISMSVVPNKWLGRPLHDDVLKGTSTSSPFEQINFWVSDYAINPALGSTVLCIADLEFTTLFTEPKVPIES